MNGFSNLISDSLLINETIALLQDFGGSATAVEVVDSVMNIPQPEPSIAKLLVSDLVKNDPRLSLNDGIVELTPLNHDALNLFETDYVVLDFEDNRREMSALSCHRNRGVSRRKKGRLPINSTRSSILKRRFQFLLPN